MIKGVLKGKKADGTEVSTIFIGLTDENLRRLREDMPIHVEGSDILIDGIDVVVFAGRTEDSIIRALKDHGFRIGDVHDPDDGAITG